MSPSDFFSKAPVVVRVVAKKSEVRWGKDEQSQKKLFTYTDFEVLESLKGNVTTPSIVARELGGELDGIGLSVPGAAHFESDQEYVVSLAATTEDGVYRVFALSQGVLEVRNDEGRKTVQGILTSQESVDFEKIKASIKTTNQPNTTLINKPAEASPVNQKSEEKSPEPSNSPSLWIWICLIIVGAGTWMIFRK